MLESGYLASSTPEIAENPDEHTFQYAIVNSENKLLGYFSYRVNWYDDCAYNFGLLSFDKGNIIIGRDIRKTMEFLVSRFHRVSWMMIEGNPVERSYDKFCDKYNGNKIIFHDVFKDRQGKFRNSICYEIIKGD